MKRRLGVVTAGAVLAAPLVVGLAGPASAASGGEPAAAGCVQAGLGFLRDNGLLQAAAHKQIDYSTIGPNGAGLISVQLPAGAYLALGQVVKLHTTNPEIFSWCR